MNPVLITTRIIFSFLILAFPLVGGAFAIYLDGTDWHTRYVAGLLPFGDYQLIDKGLDLFYLGFLLFVAFHLRNKVIRSVLFVLFLYRLVGVVLFELTHNETFLFLFPNIFENYFFFYYILKSVARYEPKISWAMIIFTIFLVSIPKMLDEYAMHLVHKPLVFDFFGISLSYTFWHEIVFIVLAAVIFGFIYRGQRRS